MYGLVLLVKVLVHIFFPFFFSITATLLPPLDEAVAINKKLAVSPPNVPCTVRAVLCNFQIDPSVSFDEIGSFQWQYKN